MYLIYFEYAECCNLTVKLSINNIFPYIYITHELLGLKL